MRDRLNYAATALGLVTAIFMAGMAWQELRANQAKTDEQIRVIKQVILAEHPEYTLNLYP